MKSTIAKLAGLSVLALAVASLLVSYAILAEWPDKASAGVPPGAVRPAN